jgi:tungstate transport system permease protein
VIAIIMRTLQVSASAVIIGAVIGIPLGTLLGMKEFPRKRLVLTALYTAMGLPPVVVGLAVYLLLSRQGPLGAAGLLFTPTAMVLAETILATPLIAGVTTAAVMAVDPAIREAAVIDGASPRQVGFILLREAQFGVIVAVVAGFGRAISEVGAVMMVGGDIEGFTRVMTTAVVLETRKGNFELAGALGVVLLGLSFAVNLVLQTLQPGISGSSLRG